MKKYLTAILVSSFITVGGYAQDLKTANVPDVVRDTFLKKFPQSNEFKVTWEKEKGNYEANWGGKSGEDNSVKMTPAGTFIEIVKAIPSSKLPANASAYLKKTMPKSKILEVGLVTDANGTVTYEAELKGQKKEVVFDKDGNYLKME